MLALRCTAHSHRTALAAACTAATYKAAQLLWHVPKILTFTDESCILFCDRPVTSGHRAPRRGFYFPGNPMRSAGILR